MKELDLSCPPLPQTLLRAIELSNAPKGPMMEEVIDLVKSDPAVAARLLQVVNSAYFGQRGRITTIDRACMVLGTAAIMGLVMSMSLQEVRSTLDSRTAPPFLHLVRHSIATAYFAQRALDEAPAPPDNYDVRQEAIGSAYTAGLIHDFGKLMLLYNFPKEASEYYGVRAKEKQAREAGRVDEEELFGYDHVETGVYLTKEHNMPEALTSMVACHHDVEKCDTLDQTMPVAYALIAGNKAANAFGFALDDSQEDGELAEDSFWDHIGPERLWGYRSGEELISVLRSARASAEAYVGAVT